jgi:hypothetical protein
MSFVRTWLFALFLFGSAPNCFAQGALLQGGPWTPGHAPMYGAGGNSQAIAVDSGPAKGGGIGVGLSELGITAQGTGAAPYAGQGTGPYGTNVCDYDAPITNATGYHFVCFSANAQGGALIAVGYGGVASALPLNINVNGIVYPFPGTAASPAHFSTLPACASGIEGTTAPVTDSTTNVWGATITGSGVDHVLAYCDGANWTVAAK